MTPQEFDEKYGWLYACESCRGLGFIYITSAASGGTTTRKCNVCNGTCIEPNCADAYRLDKANQTKETA